MSHHLRIVLVALGLALVAASCASDEPTPQEVVAGAFERTGEATTYRLHADTAQTLSSAALGVDSSAEIDIDAPALSAEIAPGASHHRIDISRQLGPISGDIDDLVMELWIRDDRMIVDSNAYQVVLDIDPQVELGPFTPGIWFVDLARIDIDDPDLLAAVVGSAPPDLAAIAVELPAALDGVTIVEPDLYRGTGSYAAVTEALGGDIEANVGAMISGLALNMPVDVDALSEVLVDYYEQLDTEVTIEVVDGLARTVTTRVDQSGLFMFIFADVQAAALGISEAEAAAARAAFPDTEWVVEAAMRFEPDDDLTIPTGPDTDDDRTDAYIDLLIQAGIIDG